MTGVSWLFVSLCSFCASEILSTDVTACHRIVHIFPSARLIGLEFVSIYVQLALFAQKNCLLKDQDNVFLPEPEPILAGGRAARLSHDVVMLAGREM